MRDHYRRLGFVEGANGTWKLPSRISPGSTLSSSISKQRSRKVSHASVESICAKLSAIPRFDPVVKRAQPEIQDGLITALSAFRIGQSARQSREENFMAMEAMDAVEAADRLMHGLAASSPGQDRKEEWRDYMEVRLVPTLRPPPAFVRLPL